MKRILYILIAALTLLTSCKRSIDVPEPVLPGTSIELGISMASDLLDGNSDKSNTSATRAAGDPGQPGSIMEEIADFGETSIALFAINNKTATGPAWATAERLIDDRTAKVNVDQTDPTVGLIAYGAPLYEPAHFPPDGVLNLYSLYPTADNGPITFTAEEGTGKPVVDLTIAPTYLAQYDVLYAKLEKQTTAQAKNLQLKYAHTLAQLQIIVTRDDKETATLNGKIHKVTVEAVNKASFPLDNHAVEAMTIDKTDMPSHTVYENVAGLAIPATGDSVTLNKIEAEGVTTYGPLMLIPGTGVVKSITITLDEGNTAKVEIDPTWLLVQGAQNSLTITFRKFNVITAEQWTVASWNAGSGADEELAPQGRKTTLVTSLCNAEKVVANPAVVPTHADIEIEGNFTAKEVAVTVEGGVLTTAEFDSEVIHDQNIQVTAIKLYRGSEVVFDSKLYGEGGTTSNNNVLYIDQVDEILKIAPSITAEGSATVLSTVFGGFGEGTALFPYEVSNPETLQNLKSFAGKANSPKLTGKASVGAYFKQVTDITLSSNFTPIDWLCGSFDGGNFKINNLVMDLRVYTTVRVGLFARLFPSVQNGSEIKNVTIASGSIYRKGGPNGYLGGVVGEIRNAVIENCVNYAIVSSDGSLGAAPRGTGIGGVVGYLGANAIMRECANFGLVEGDNRVGGLVGMMLNSASMKDCFNAGDVTQAGTFNSTTGGIGGLAGYVQNNNLTPVVESCYNIGTITTSGNHNGSLVGVVFGKITAGTVSDLFYPLGGSDPVGLDNSNPDGFTSIAVGMTLDNMKLQSFAVSLNGAGAGVWVLNNKIPTASGDPYTHPVFNWMK